MNNPKVFISHASEDKDTFVTNFATKLRGKGVDAWLDSWEISPGDSLVDKIFEKGLKEADTVVIILSSYSVKKPWVIHELETSIANRNNGKKIKIIPIILDDCEVPQSLATTNWVKIDNLTSYDESFTQICNAIFGMTDKPALGAVPDYVSNEYREIGGLIKTDNLVLKAICDYVVKQNWFLTAEKKQIFGESNQHGISDSEISDSIGTLEANKYLEVTEVSSGCIITVTVDGFESYAQAYIDGYEALKQKTISAIVNEEIEGVNDISSKLNEPTVIIYHIFNLLKSEKRIDLIEYCGDMDIWVGNVKPSLKRLLHN